MQRDVGSKSGFEGALAIVGYDVGRNANRNHVHVSAVFVGKQQQSFYIVALLLFNGKERSAVLNIAEVVENVAPFKRDIGWSVVV